MFAAADAAEILASLDPPPGEDDSKKKGKDKDKDSEGPSQGDALTALFGINKLATKTNAKAGFKEEGKVPLGDNVHVLDVWTEGMDQPTADGEVYLLFFPNGYTQEAHYPFGRLRASGDDRARVATHRKKLHHGGLYRGSQMRSRGFTLLEVLIALMILSISLTVLLQAQASSLANAGRSRDITIATLLARSKLIDIEKKLFHEGFVVNTEDEDGNFREEGHEEITWKYRVSEIKLDLSALSSLCGSLSPGEGKEAKSKKFEQRQRCGGWQLRAIARRLRRAHVKLHGRVGAVHAHAGTPGDLARRRLPTDPQCACVTHAR